MYHTRSEGVPDEMIGSESKRLDAWDILDRHEGGRGPITACSDHSGFLDLETRLMGALLPRVPAKPSTVALTWKRMSTALPHSIWPPFANDLTRTQRSRVSDQQRVPR